MSGLKRQVEMACEGEACHSRVKGTGVFHKLVTSKAAESQHRRRRIKSPKTPETSNTVKVGRCGQLAASGKSGKQGHARQRDGVEAWTLVHCIIFA